MAKKESKKEVASPSPKTGASVNIGISDKNRQSVANLLQILLADEFVLYTKTRNCHWNVEGIHFGQLHKFFEAQYEALDEVMDSVAERIRKVGHYAVGTLGGFLKITHLVEAIGDGPTANDMIATLLDDHETVIRFIRESIDPINNTYKDAGTADFITGLLEEHEQMAWMLRAHLA